MGETRRGPERNIDEEIIAQMEAMGAKAEEIAALRARNGETAKDHVVEVVPEIWNAFRVFRLVQRSQWRCTVASDGKYLKRFRTGLDYSALPVAAGACGVALDEATLGYIGDMEAVALGIFDARLRR